MIFKKRSADPGKVTVHFEIPGTIWAEQINLVGDFNGWNLENLSFRHDRAGNWVIELDLEVGREYRFRYLLGGREWRDEWQADKFVPNDYGSYDSIVVVEAWPEDADDSK